MAEKDMGEKIDSPKDKSEKDDKKSEEKKEEKEEKKKQEEEKKKQEEEKKKQEEEKKKQEEESKAKKQEEFIDDITATQVQVEEEENTKQLFSKTKLGEDVPFSFFNIDQYLHNKYRGISQLIRHTIEALLVVMILMLFPILLMVVLKNERNNILTHLFTKEGSGEKTENVLLYVKINVFLSLWYVTYTLVFLLSENILHISIYVLNFLKIEIKEILTEVLQVLKQTSVYWTQAITNIIVFILANLLLKTYAIRSKNYSVVHLYMTALLWYGSSMLIFFVERFLMNLLISEIRRKEYRQRIWEINYKTFIFKKLILISQAKPSDRKEISQEMVPDFDPGFYLKYNDIGLKSEESARIIAESIFGYFEIQELLYDEIELYFKENPQEVYSYLLGVAGVHEIDETHKPIKFKQMCLQLEKLYQERVDIQNSLHDRDRIFLKLDFILTAGTFCLSIFLGMFLLNVVDSFSFLSMLGPIIFSFSWIFSDTIKDIYRCFVFLLVNHPYDCGDRVIIDSEELMVKRVDLFFTTFVNQNNRISYIPNISLFNKKIDNIRRSIRQSEQLPLKVGKTTTFSQALELKKDLERRLRESPKDFTGNVLLKSYTIDGDDLVLLFAFQHKSNFQDFNERFRRRKALVRIIEQSCNLVGISPIKSYPFID